MRRRLATGGRLDINRLTLSISGSGGAGNGVLLHHASRASLASLLQRPLSYNQPQHRALSLSTSLVSASSSSTSSSASTASRDNQGLPLFRNVNSSPTFETARALSSFTELSANDRKRMRQQKKGNTIALPEFIGARDLAHRLHITLMSLHKAGSTFFDWWPRASERQMKRDGFSMLKDLILRFDESAMLVNRLGYDARYEHLGIETIRESHYDVKRHRDLHRSPRTPIEHVPERDRPAQVQPKQPVVCILGHVDHGKTTLLDTLRGARVAATEDAGITQDLYTFQAVLPDDILQKWTDNDMEAAQQDPPPLQPGQSPDIYPFEKEELFDIYRKVTFLDTPGHVGFFDMRENAVHFCDVAVLVVSAVEGVDAQTIEALEYVRDFKVPLVVAITKCDLPNAQPEKVLAALRGLGVDVRDPSDPEAFSRLYPVESRASLRARRKAAAAAAAAAAAGAGGSVKPVENRTVPYVTISAKTGLNMDQLQWLLLRTFMTIRPQCDLEAPPCGLIIEAFNDEGGRGRVLRALLASGTISPRDSFITGVFAGKVRDVRAVGIPPRQPSSSSTSSSSNSSSSTSISSSDVSSSSASSSDGAARAGDGAGVRRGRVNVGARLALALPGVPLDITGSEGMPQAGDDLRVVHDESLCRAISEVRRLAVEYPAQSRFTLGGASPDESWVPPEYGSETVVLTAAEWNAKQAAMKKLDRKNRLAVIRDIEDDDYDGVAAAAGAGEENDDMAEAEFVSEEGEVSASGEANRGTSDKNGDAIGSKRHAGASSGRLQSASSPSWTSTIGAGSSSASTISAAAAAAAAVAAHRDEANGPVRRLIVKAGTVGGLRMIMDSLAAYNDAHPDTPVLVVHGDVGGLERSDLDKALMATTEAEEEAQAIGLRIDPVPVASSYGKPKGKNAENDDDEVPDNKQKSKKKQKKHPKEVMRSPFECPVLLFRTRPLTRAQEHLAMEYKADVQHYTVYDDLLKAAVGESGFNSFIANAKSLRMRTVDETYLPTAVPQLMPDPQAVAELAASKQRQIVIDSLRPPSPVKVSVSTNATATSATSHGRSSRLQRELDEQMKSLARVQGLLTGEPDLVESLEKEEERENEGVREDDDDDAAEEEEEEMDVVKQQFSSHPQQQQQHEDHTVAPSVELTPAQLAAIEANKQAARANPTRIPMRTRKFKLPSSLR